MVKKKNASKISRSLLSPPFYFFPCCVSSTTRIERPLSRRRVCDLLTYPKVRSATAKNQDKAGLPRLANRCETMSPTKPNYEWIPLDRKPNKKTRGVNAPNPFTPHGSQSSDNNLGRKSDSERTFQKRCFRIATTFSRASRARLKIQKFLYNKWRI